MQISSRAIVVIDYDPAWPDAFEAIKRDLEGRLAGLLVEIFHIGSTAIPGLCAKPKIDVDVVLTDAAAIPGGIERA